MRTTPLDAGIGLVAALLALGGCIGGGGDAPSPTLSGRAPAPSAAATASAEPAEEPTRSPIASATATPAPTPATVVAVGDIAACEVSADEAVAGLVAGLDPSVVVTLGDHAYANGTRAEFAECYDPAWGVLRERTRPVLGNHDYHTELGAPYFEYFGAVAGAPGEGWYSFDVGDWHFVALNSNCELVGCGADSPQGRWLAADLAGSDALCTAAVWHHPRWSSGPDGNIAKTDALWRILTDAGVELLLSGHAHHYERLAPLDANGTVDEQRGVRQFVVGTGGRSLYGFGAVNPASQARNNDTYGALHLTLHPDAYDWEFVPVNAGGFTDSDSERCH